MLGRAALLGLLAAAISPSVAQFENWAEDQVSTEICVWYQPRVALVRDVVYLDGGDIWWLPVNEKNQNAAASNKGNNGGWILAYNLTTPFDSGKTNVTGILLDSKAKLSKARGGAGNADIPAFYDGAMLANDAEFYLFGGTLPNLGTFDEPDGDEVLGYRAYEYGVEKPNFKVGYDEVKLEDGINRYVAFGGAANAPSENKAWYFPGLTSPSHGPILTTGIDEEKRATEVSNRLITLDMTTQMKETWTNTSLPKFIKGRANPEVVWVPVGEQGILVVLGGVLYPEWVGQSHKSSDEEASEEESPVFMSTIDIYDIANDDWYQQTTEDGPGALTRGCAVVAPASDYSSFNIYYYGGYDGIHVKEAFSDEVWVLSIPSFTWTKVNDGESIHARAGHKCVKPYPDQMMVFGGGTPLAGNTISCLKDGPVVVFNLTSAKWMSGYDPAEYSEYGVPDKVIEKIGGDAKGGATATTPEPSGWETSALGKVFETAYNSSKIESYYPYESATTTTRPDLDDGDSNSDDSKKEGGGGGGLPKWVAPVLGVVLGLMFLSGMLVLFCLWRRRKYLRRQSDAGTEDTGMRIISWMRGQPPPDKAPTVTTSEDTPMSPEMEHIKAAAIGAGTTPASSVTPVFAVTTTPAPAEMADDHIAELADTSAPVELHDTGLSPVEVIQRYSRIGQDNANRSLSSPSNTSGPLGDHTSDISSAAPPSVVHEMSSAGSPPQAMHTRLASDVSAATSDADPAAATAARAVSPSLSPGLPPAGGMVVSPRSETFEESKDEAGPANDQAVVSPPTAADSPAEDYLSVRSTAVSPMRKSVFVEHDDDDEVAKPK